jgi:ABC-type multidrug transport system fused ATPase/permease subunit
VIRHIWRQLGPLLRRPTRLLVGLGLVSAVGGLAEAVVLVLVVRVALLAAGPPGEAVHVPGAGEVRPAALLWVASGMAVASLALHAVVAGLSARMAADVLTSARARAIDAFIDASWERQDGERDGALQEAVSTLAEQSSAVAISFVAGVTAALGIAAFLAIAVVIDPVSTLAVTVLGVLLFGALRPMARVTQRRARRFVAANSDFAIDVGHAGSLAMEHRLYGVRRAAADRLHAANRRTAGLQEASRFASRLGATVYRDLAVLTLVGAVAALHATDQQRRLAGVGTVAVLVIRALAGAQVLQGNLHALREQGPGLDLLDARVRSLEASRPPAGTLALPGIGTVELAEVGYAYPSGRRALDRVSLRIEPGEAIGVTGPSGSGKSTLAQVLLRLRAPSDGTVTVDGTPYGRFAEADWARLVAFVPQEPRLIEATVAENIAFLRTGVSRREVERAAAAAHVDGEVRALPAGFDTVLGSGGAGLSVGQKQRVAIARALAGHPRLLVLDEPTSTLDAESERLLQETIDRLSGLVTLVIIAHRLTTLRSCSRVVVLRDGSVEAVGAPEAVLRGPGIDLDVTVRGTRAGAPR